MRATSDTHLGTSEPYRWVILGITLYVVLVNVGMAYFVGTALSPFFSVTLKLDRQVLGAIFSLFTLLTGISGPLVATGVERLGPRRMLVGGSAVVTVGAAAMGTIVTNGAHALIAYGVIVGIGTGVGGLIAGQTLVARWFLRNPGGAIAAVVASTAVGGIITAPVMALLSTTPGLGWRSGWLLLAIMSAIGGLAALVLVRDRPNALTSSSHAEHVATAAEEGPDPWPLRRIVRTLPFFALILGSMGLSGSNSFILAHALVHLQDLGRTAADQATWLLVFTLAQLVFICCAGVAGRRTGMRVLLAASLAAQGLGVWLIQDPGPVTFYLSAVMAGGGFGGSMTALMAVPAEFYGMRAYARVLGAIMPVMTISGAVSALAAGRVFDATHSYLGAAIAIEAIVVSAVALLLIVRAPKAV